MFRRLTYLVNYSVQFKGWTRNFLRPVSEQNMNDTLRNRHSRARFLTSSCTSCVNCAHNIANLHRNYADLKENRMDSVRKPLGT